MTVQEAARELDVSIDLVYRLCRAGRLAHSRIGLGRGVIRLCPQDIAEFKASCRVEADYVPEVKSDRKVAYTDAGPIKLPGIFARMDAEKEARAAAKQAKEAARLAAAQAGTKARKGSGKSKKSA